MIPWNFRKDGCFTRTTTSTILPLLLLLTFLSRCILADSIASQPNLQEAELRNYVDELFSGDKVEIMPGLTIEPTGNLSKPSAACVGNDCADVSDYFYKKWNQYIEEHVLAVNVSETSRFLSRKYLLL